MRSQTLLLCFQLLQLRLFSGFQTFAALAQLPL
ncbi:exported hypothetical protein [Xanthomonas phaseoli pv. phaseoli]|uniref:Uncharacterized protein n=1 Tax=Xanthomonas campestris pv. phaseoli TaxID=317013 RepID=A0A7Z7NEV9_XANCH|nr:exported hypothetical protein [Xanthomonas phaseoli pv. phaseoli]